MKLIAKRHLFKMIAYDPDNQPLYQIKSNPWNMKKSIQTVNNEILYYTDIISLKPSSASSGSSTSRVYMVYQKSLNSKPVVKASLGYDIPKGQDTRHFYPDRVPQVNRLNLQMQGSQNLYVKIQLLKDGSCQICNGQDQVVGKISEHHLFNGYVIESSAISDGGLLCALFVLTRYMVKENELIVV